MERLHVRLWPYRRVSCGGRVDARVLFTGKLGIVALAMASVFTAISRGHQAHQSILGSRMRSKMANMKTFRIALPLKTGIRPRRLFSCAQDEPTFEEYNDDTILGKSDGATGSGMVAIDDLWKEKREVTEDDLMRSGQKGYFTPEFEATFKYQKGSTVWYKSITHMNQWIKAEVEGFSGQDLDGVRYYNLDVSMTPIPHDPCVRRENVEERILRSLEEGIPEGEVEYKGGATMWLNPHLQPTPPRQFRPEPVKVKRNVGHPSTMFWRDGPRTPNDDPYLSFQYKAERRVAAEFEEVPIDGLDLDAMPLEEEGGEDSASSKLSSEMKT